MATVILMVQLAACLAVLLVPLEPALHSAPVTISGPPVVTSALADQANAHADHPLDAGTAVTADDAREDVEQGRAVAAVAIDLRHDRTTVFVSSAQGEALGVAVTALVRATAEPFASTVVVEDVAPLPAGSSGQSGLRLVVVSSVALGLGIAVALTWRRGPVADTWAEALGRMGAAGGIGAGGALAIATFAAHQAGGGVGGWWLVVWLTAVATSAATLALEGLLGVAGIGLATTVFVVTAAPLARVEHPLMLPAPWGPVTPWLPHGAGLDAARQVAWFGGAGAARPIAVLVSWLVVSCVVLAVARRERRRAGVVWSGALRPIRP